MATDLSTRIREARVGLGLGLRKLARMLDISPTHLSDIENNRRIPSEDLLKKLAENLQLDFDELMVQIGKVYNVTEKYVQKVPQAVTLFRKVSEHNLSPADLKKLEARAEQLASRKAENKN